MNQRKKKVKDGVGSTLIEIKSCISGKKREGKRIVNRLEVNRQVGSRPDFKHDCDVFLGRDDGPEEAWIIAS